MSYLFDYDGPGLFPPGANRHPEVLKPEILDFGDKELCTDFHTRLDEGAFEGLPVLSLKIAKAFAAHRVAESSSAKT